MSLTTIISLYYGIGTPLFILLMFMISHSSKDQHIVDEGTRYPVLSKHYKSK